VVAAADCYDGCLEHAKELWGRDILTTRDYNEILARKDIDAVIIGTPDHWHMQASVDAMNAGKDVYCEKPMIHLYSDGPKIIDTWRKTNRIMQVGSQRVSSIVYKKAKELLAAGAIGKLNMVTAWYDRNSAHGRVGLYGSLRCLTHHLRLAALARAPRPRFRSTANTSSNGASGRPTEAAWRAICLSTCSVACT
jgi:predicted dehydrogenase